VTLLQGATGAQVLAGLLRQAQVEYPSAFEGLELPSDTAGFKGRLAALLPLFEGARVQSEQASEIARSMALGAAAHVRVVSTPESAAGTQREERALQEVLGDSAQALPLVRVDLPGPRRLVPSADYAGRLYVERELGQLGSELAQARYATRALAEALAKLGRRSEGAGLSLVGERFVLFGAAAELSPVYTLLEAGAEVLWLDRERPPIDHLLEPRLGGALMYVDRGVDLLTQPAEIRATIVEFARGRPLHFGLHAFAPGSAHPLLLSLTMNEIVRSLPSEIVASVSFLLSPTSVSPIYGEDAQRAEELRSAAPAMRRALLRARSLSPGYLRLRDQRLSCAVVPQQGASFQAAEYVAKRLMAEALLVYGSTLAGTRGALEVFANMAPITATRSLASPMMEAAILGAPSYDIMIAKPSTARAVSSLLTVYDVLDSKDRAQHASARDGSGRLGADGARASAVLLRSRLFARQFHGGVHAQPYALDGIVRMAALRGLAQRPKLALELLR
jgi:hypothetical protein